MIEFISQLPTEYQEVEYIESSGTQYIDTGYKPNQDSKIVLDMQAASSAVISGVHMFYGVQGSTSWMFGKASSSNWSAYGYYNTTEKLLLEWTQVNYAKRRTVVQDKNNFSFDSVSTNVTYAAFQSTNNAYLFGVNANGSVKYLTAMTLYSCQMYDNGALIRDFVPCYRKGDNAAGLYDLVTGTFLANAGSGTFAVGNNSNKRGEWVITAGGIIPMQYSLRRRMMQSNEKTWTVTIQNKAQGDASPYYPKINGIASGPGIYKVRDGDVITLYGYVGSYELYAVSVIFIDDKFWRANYGQTISQQHIAQTDCKIVISSMFSNGYSYITKLTTT